MPPPPQCAAGGSKPLLGFGACAHNFFRASLSNTICCRGSSCFAHIGGSVKGGEGNMRVLERPVLKEAGGARSRRKPRLLPKSDVIMWLRPTE